MQRKNNDRKIIVLLVVVLLVIAFGVPRIFNSSGGPIEKVSIEYVPEEVVLVDRLPLGEMPPPPPPPEDTSIHEPITIFEEFESKKAFTLGVGFLYQDTTSRAPGNLRNPTYQEAIDFVKSDKTNEINRVGKDSKVYKDEDWLCADYASTFRDNANKEGLRCAVAALYLATLADTEEVTLTHAIVAFETLDRGLQYFEPQDDSYQGTLRQGQIYPEPWNTQATLPLTYNVTRQVILLW